MTLIGTDFETDPALNVVRLNGAQLPGDHGEPERRSS